MHNDSLIRIRDEHVLKRHYLYNMKVMTLQRMALSCARIRIVFGRICMHFINCRVAWCRIRGGRSRWNNDAARNALPSSRHRSKCYPSAQENYRMVGETFFWRIPFVWSGNSRRIFLSYVGRLRVSLGFITEVPKCCCCCWLFWRL